MVATTLAFALAHFSFTAAFSASSTTANAVSTTVHSGAASEENACPYTNAHRRRSTTPDEPNDPAYGSSSAIYTTSTSPAIYPSTSSAQASPGTYSSVNATEPDNGSDSDSNTTQQSNEPYSATTSKSVPPIPTPHTVVTAHSASSLDVPKGSPNILPTEATVVAAHSDSSLDVPKGTSTGAHTPVPSPVTAHSDSSLLVPGPTRTGSSFVVHTEHEGSNLIVPTGYPGSGQGPGGDYNPVPDTNNPYPDSSAPGTDNSGSQAGGGSGNAASPGPGSSSSYPDGAGSQSGAGSGAAPHQGAGDALPVSVGGAGAPSTLVTTVPGSATTVNGRVFTLPPTVQTVTVAAGSADSNGHGGGEGGGGSSTSSQAAGQNLPSSTSSGNAASASSVSRPNNNPAKGNGGALSWSPISESVAVLVAVGVLGFM